MTTRHIYVDETKERGYVMVASAHLGTDAAALRTAMRRLVLPGQHRLHMAKESPSRRRAITDAICSAGVTATIYDAGRRYSNDLSARAACLEALIADIATGQQTLLVIEQDESLIRWDKQRLIEIVRTVGCGDHVRYEHNRARAELLLSIPDAIAWCWARGGHWRQRVAAMTDIRPV